MSYATVNRWENGQAKPSKLTQAQLDAFYKAQFSQGKLEITEVIR